MITPLPALATANWKLIGVGALGLVLIITHWIAYSKGVHTERNRWQIVQAKEAVDRAAQEKKNRDETERRVNDQTTIANNAIQERDKARADADAASAAGVRLRTKIRDLTLSVALHDPASVSGGEATAETVNMLGIVQQGLDGASEQLARYADDAGTAGRACEASYDALTKETP